MTNEELIRRAAGVLRPQDGSGGARFGTVAATLVTDEGNAYDGVCIDTACGTGFCAEHAAIAAMVTAGEYRIARIVAVGRSSGDGRVRVMPPCGRCREFIRLIDEGNLETEVVLGVEKVMRLRELLPEHEWRESST